MKKITALLLLTLAMSSQAELVDLTTNQTISSVGNEVQQALNETTKFSPENPRWIKKPSFKVHHFPHCYCTQSLEPSSSCFQKIWSVTTKLRINEQGNITSIRIINSNAGQRIDRDITRSLKRSTKFKPFKKDGVAVKGAVVLPIKVVNTQYNPKLQCPAENNIDKI